VKPGGIGSVLETVGRRFPMARCGDIEAKGCAEPHGPAPCMCEARRCGRWESERAARVGAELRSARRAAGAEVQFCPGLRDRATGTPEEVDPGTPRGWGGRGARGT
jgi:hypothetical protein